MKWYEIEYETLQGIITHGVVAAPCKEKALDCWRQERKEEGEKWRDGSESILRTITKSSKNLKPELYEQKRTIKRNKGIYKECLRKAKKLVKHSKNKRWEEKHPEKAEKRKKVNEPINNI